MHGQSCSRYAGSDIPWDLLGSSTMDYCLQFNRHCGESSTRTYDLIYIFRDQSFCWEEISIDHVFLSVISSFFFFFFFARWKIPIVYHCDHSDSVSFDVGLPSCLIWRSIPRYYILWKWKMLFIARNRNVLLLPPVDYIFQRDRVEHNALEREYLASPTSPLSRDVI